jgi:hypothetical protein
MAAGTLATLALTTRPAAAGKISQAASQYQDTPKGDQRCDGCAFFTAPNGCRLVDGVIAAAGWCKLYAKKS